MRPHVFPLGWDSVVLHECHAPSQPGRSPASTPSLVMVLPALSALRHSEPFCPTCAGKLPSVVPASLLGQQPRIWPFLPDCNNPSRCPTACCGPRHFRGLADMQCVCCEQVCMAGVTPLCCPCPVFPSLHSAGKRVHAALRFT